MITQDEFKQSLISCGFKWPENNQDTLKQKHVHLKRIIPLAKICDKSELAMFLANIYHESQGLAQISEINPRDDYDGGIRYKGRGYIQLTHKYNYAAASKDLYDDNILVDKPELVEEEESIAWDTTAWFWRTYVCILVYFIIYQFQFMNFV